MLKKQKLIEKKRIGLIFNICLFKGTYAVQAYPGKLGLSWFFDKKERSINFVMQ